MAGSGARAAGRNRSELFERGGHPEMARRLLEEEVEMKGHDAQGFTLLELMIVVIILGVLAAIAVPSFQSQYHQSKSSEAQALLRDIAAKQEAFKSEFGQYLNVSGSFGFGNRRPSAAPRADFGYVDWTDEAGAIDLGWRQLGFRPQSAVRFSYIVVAGLPGVDPTSAGVPAGLASSADHWWAAAAFGNADRSPIGAIGDCSQFYLSSTQNIMGVVNESR
jgi:prepilin-type N-terminal cleavage/methylation domain-containing protein